MLAGMFAGTFAGIFAAEEVGEASACCFLFALEA
jgi:hypothetical protein